MDREKLNKAAEEYASAYIIPPDLLCAEIVEGFMEGADWLMSQPLSERLTDEEKEKIRKIYKREVNSMELETGRIKDAQSQIEQLCHESNFWQAKLKADMLESIFGADLFKEK